MTEMKDDLVITVQNFCSLVAYTVSAYNEFRGLSFTLGKYCNSIRYCTNALHRYIEHRGERLKKLQTGNDHVY